MILGIGVDIIEVSRIRDAYARLGDRFLRRIMLDSEIAYCLAHSDPAPHLAARFAAKEAVSKAFGTGIGAELGWVDMEVVKQPGGAPRMLFHGVGRDLMERRGATALHLSLSHTAQYAVAQAILES